MLDQALTDSWDFFKRHFAALAALVLPVVIPLQLVLAMYDAANVEQGFDMGNAFLMMMIGFVFYALYMPAVIFYIASVVTGEKRSTGELYQLALKWWGPFLLLLLLVTFFSGVGFMLLIVPGIIIILKLAFAEFDMLLNGSGPVTAMKTSWRMTKGRKGTLFGGYLIITLAIYIPFIILEAILAGVGMAYWWVNAAVAILVAVCNLFYTIFAFRVYDLVVIEEREKQAQESAPPQDLNQDQEQSQDQDQDR